MSHSSNLLRSPRARRYRRRHPSKLQRPPAMQPSIQFTPRSSAVRLWQRSGGATRCHRDRQHSDHSVFDGVPEQTVRNVVEQERVRDSASTRTASSRHFHRQRLAPAGPTHRPLAHWLFHVHRAPERRLRVLCHGWPRCDGWPRCHEWPRCRGWRRHTPCWQNPEAHWWWDQQRAPDGALAMLGVASSRTRLAPRMR